MDRSALGWTMETLRWSYFLNVDGYLLRSVESFYWLIPLLFIQQASNVFIQCKFYSLTSLLVNNDYL